MNNKKTKEDNMNNEQPAKMSAADAARAVDTLNALHAAAYTGTLADAVAIANRVLDNSEAVYPLDKRSRKAIQAAQAWLDCPTKKDNMNNEQPAKMSAAAANADRAAIAINALYTTAGTVTLADAVAYAAKAAANADRATAANAADAARTVAKMVLMIVLLLPLLLPLLLTLLVLIMLLLVPLLGLMK